MKLKEFSDNGDLAKTNNKKNIEVITVIDDVGIDNSGPPICPVCGQSPCICKSEGSDVKYSTHEYNDYDFRKVDWNKETLDYLKNEVYDGQDKNAEIKDIDDAIKGIRDLTKENIKEATNIALNNKHGEYYTDHNEGHIEQVTYKSIEAGKAFADMAADGGFDYGDVANNDKLVKFGSDIDYKVLAGAAMSHDTGMSDHGYNVYMNKGEPKRDADGKIEIKLQDNIDRKEFDNVRSSHTLNSAINILKRRDEYTKLGYSDEQIDNMAVLAFAHSKSNSGLQNLINKDNWKTCFDVLDAAIGKYNEDNADAATIKFDRSKAFSDDNLSKLALSTLALRVGDVSRDSGDGALSQSGEIININKERIKKDAKNFKDEVSDDNSVMIKTADGKIKSMKNDDEDSYIKSRQCHTGEQNIIHNKTYYDKNTHQLVHEILINDGEHAKYCTAEAIKDHIGEFGSAGSGNFQFVLKSKTGKINEEVYDKEFAKYEVKKKINKDRIKISYNEV